jgi:hypothetical protein
MCLHSLSVRLHDSRRTRSHTHDKIEAYRMSNLNAEGNRVPPAMGMGRRVPHKVRFLE